MRALRARRNLVLAVVLGAAALGGVFVAAAPGGNAPPPYVVSVSPGSVTAGSGANTLVFSFSSNGQQSGLVSLVVPAVAIGSAWSAPQSTTPGAAGYVTVRIVTCPTASLSSISGNGGGPWTIVASAHCAPNQTFRVTYGGSGGGAVSAPSLAGGYSFTAQAQG